MKEVKQQGDKSASKMAAMLIENTEAVPAIVEDIVGRT